MKSDIASLQTKLKDLEGFLKIRERIEKLAVLEKKTLASSFWDDPRAARDVLKEIEDEKGWLTLFTSSEKALADALLYQEMASQGNDPEAEREREKSLSRLEGSIGALEMKKMLDGPDDACDAIFEIHSGAGGTESQDWAEMLLRMYTRYFERKGFQNSIIDYLAGEEAGLKTAVLTVKGPNAFGYLKAEIGVHRLVRISPFDSNARRHTSFASVSALPMEAVAGDFLLNEAEIRVDTFRSGGAGGQHVNKTESAVRMTHIPTGIVAQCQSERSQMKNRDNCMKLLTARVRSFVREEEDKARVAKAAKKKKIEWGSQIRSYVLHPYNLVKDHRTDLETSNTASVLDGELDDFIRAYLLMK